MSLLRSISWIVVVLIVAASVPALAARGYVPRACGFDMDGDGVAGEAADDCNVCDGAAENSGQKQTYVDCDAGSDAADGAAATPNKTITAARKAIPGGAILCWTGTCTDVEALSLPGGTGGVYKVAPRGSEVRSFDYPQTPTMLAGWDKDDDGCYPPYDSDGADANSTSDAWDSCQAAGKPCCSPAADVSVIDGKNVKANVFDNSLAGSKLEIAHGTVRNYTYKGDKSAATFFRNNGRGVANVFLHDLVLENMNRDRGGMTIVNALGHKDLDYFAIENLHCKECGGSWLLFRGGAGDGSGGLYSEYWRWKNITFDHDGGGDPEPSIWDTWGAVGGPANDGKSGIEFLDNVFDCNPESFGAMKPSCFGAAVHAGMDGIDIINNELVDFRVSFYGEITDSSGAGAVLAKLGRPSDHVRILRNVFRVPQASRFPKAVFGVQVAKGNACTPGSPPKCGGSGKKRCCSAANALETLKNLTVDDNLFSAGGKGFDSVLDIDGSHDGPCPGAEAGGTYAARNNTIVSPHVAGNALRRHGTNRLSCRPDNFDVRDNVFKSDTGK